MVGGGTKNSKNLYVLFFKIPKNPKNQKKSKKKIAYDRCKPLNYIYKILSRSAKWFGSDNATERHRVTFAFMILVWICV